jgi:hypothetical protein
MHLCKQIRRKEVIVHPGDHAFRKAAPEPRNSGIIVSL